MRGIILLIFSARIVSLIFDAIFYDTALLYSRIFLKMFNWVRFISDHFLQLTMHNWNRVQSIKCTI